MKTNPTIGVGSTIWIFDGNHRVYHPAPPGKIWSSEGPIYREHWQPHVIKGETSRSWVLGWGKKIAKKGQPGVAFTESEVDDDCWINCNRYKISREIERLRDAGKLRAIAEIIGFKP